MRASRHQYRRPILPFRGPYRVPKESYTPIGRFQGLPTTQGALWTNIWVLSVSLIHREILGGSPGIGDPLTTYGQLFKDLYALGIIKGFNTGHCGAL